LNWRAYYVHCGCEDGRHEALRERGDEEEGCG